MKAVVLGGTKGIGRAMARLMVARGDSIHLLGRSPEDLERSARDLELRGAAGTHVTWSLCDLMAPSTFAPALEHAAAELGGFDTVVVTAGRFATQDRLEQDLELAAEVLTADFTNTVLFCEHAREHLLASGGGTLCVFSSVAGDRGRKPVVLYGAAKAGLTRYLEGLDHRYQARGLRTVCVKPGFVRTSMTVGLPEPPFAADADRVAATALHAMDRGTPVVYAPGVWAVVMAIIRCLPRAVMRRVGF